LSGTTPLDKALQHLVASNNDSLVQLSTCLDADKSRLNQRFAYLAFAFSTGKGGADWFDVPNECQWKRVTCNGNGAVTHLNFHETDLIGTIPDDVGLWTSLTLFGADRNSLVGSLPSSIGFWTSLTQFDVSHNSLTGSLPSSIGLWTDLLEFFISNNKFTGTVPADVSSWQSMQRAYFFDNMFNGTMPAFGNGFCPNNGKGDDLFADCKSEIFCECCNICFWQL
jgi:Leucine-rich repeat (LRR) protein